MSHDPTLQPQPPAPQGAYPPPPPAPQAAYPPPPPAPGGYAPAPYAGPGYAPGYAYGPPLPAVLQNRTFADWGTRLGAAIVDGLFALTIIGYFVNFFLMGREGERNGQTLGKQVCNIRVVKEDGQPVTAGYAVLREFVIKGLLVGFVGGFFFIPWLVNYLWPLWDDRKQALHDKVGSSYVVQA